MILFLGILALIFVSIPTCLFVRNLLLYHPAPKNCANTKSTPVSVLIPARNEESTIEGVIKSVLSNTGVEFELVVLDDCSEDATARLVGVIAADNDCVRLIRGEPLPEGWCGKQFACAQLAKKARHPSLLFLDADVRLKRDSICRMLAFLHESNAKLVSGFPRQETYTILEQLLLPLIHFILLGFLPIKRMRISDSPAYAAGCGQLFLADRAAYEASGGHESIRESLHDGITLPRAFRNCGFLTDLFDATDLASCRMYKSASQVWQGLAKNAHEGLASPRMIIPATLLLFVGQILPLCLLLWNAMFTAFDWMLVSAAICIAYVPRLFGVFRFRQSVIGALFHPIGVTLLLLIQWQSFFRRIVGGASTWKGRSYATVKSTKSHPTLEQRRESS